MSDIVASPGKLSTQPLSQDDDKVCEQEWTVVTNPKDETDTCTGGVSSHFKFQLGWGTRKFTLFSWDLNIQKEHTHNDKGSTE